MCFEHLASLAKQLGRASKMTSPSHRAGSLSLQLAVCTFPFAEVRLYVDLCIFPVFPHNPKHHLKPPSPKAGNMLSVAFVYTVPVDGRQCSLWDAQQIWPSIRDRVESFHPALP